MYAIFLIFILLILYYDFHFFHIFIIKMNVYVHKKLYSKQVGLQL